ncbi:TetR/AcrR family transcriptional regulator [Conexibacter woesei]|uniref:Regulatory protein TetR n=1 Tax=Conexibacter woesei (strain DSM 14684 / CCUG 47730 / CIP 108061 / JCM 11494 / NBRC 100937 / ID131577) TaxID=469383 RepID=D3FC96_CONWI|nr:TetR family transcriptional regulator [Conexibacter woesei]ADB53391.1 regulatory protein TetR [Conexibacter woesei DSM 14684]
MAATDHRRATAERNVSAILDAVERLLARSATVTIAAVAAESGVSRVTVYAHFDSVAALLEAVVRRAVKGALAALAAADPASGPARDALDRVVDASWQVLDRHSGMARTAAELLSAERLRASHEQAMVPVRELIERGRAEGAFRTDLPADWLVTVFYALLHATGDDVRAGRIDQASAAAVLRTTLHSVLAG